MGDPIAQFITWYKSRPILSKSYITLSFIMNILLFFEVIQVSHIYYDPVLMFSALQFWRPWTAILFLSFSQIQYIVLLYINYNIIISLQLKVFSKTHYADFIWMTLILFVYCVFAASIYPIYMMGDMFIFALIYIWQYKRPFQVTSMFLGIQMRTIYVPWIYLVVNWIMGRIFFTQCVIGLFFGIMYCYLKLKIFTKYGRDYFPTPKVFSLLIQKYLILQARYGLCIPIQEEEQYEE